MFVSHHTLKWTRTCRSHGRHPHAHTAHFLLNRHTAGTFAEQVDETDTRLWRSVAHYVDEARRLEDYTGVEAVGIDGTGRKGHGYITVVADLVEHDVTDVTPGKDPATVERFARDFMGHNGVPEYVRLVSCDMSLGFRKGIRECLPNVRRIVDKFHVARHANEAVDKAGKTEGRSNPLLKRTKYLWLRNEESLAELQLETKRNLTRCFASMFVRQVRQCFSAVWADGFPRCRHRFPVM